MQQKIFRLDDSDCQSLSLLAGAMRQSEAGVIRTLIRCAMADSPELRQLVTNDYRTKFRLDKVPA